MWVFCKHGAVSITERKYYQDGSDPQRSAGMQVRGRCKLQLEAIKEAYVDSPSAVVIYEWDTADYPYRFFISRGGVEEMCRRMAEDIDYINFKGSVEQDASAGNIGNDLEWLSGGSYTQLLMAVWSAFARWGEARRKPIEG